MSDVIMIELPDVFDGNVEAVCREYIRRAEAGRLKYGTTTERTDLTTRDWLQHLKEELMDATIYIQRLLKEKQYDER